MNKTVYQKVKFCSSWTARRASFMVYELSLQCQVHLWQKKSLSCVPKKESLINWIFHPVNEISLFMNSQTTASMIIGGMVFFYLLSNGFFYPSMNSCSWTCLFEPSMNKIVCQEPLFSRSWTALWHCSATCVHSPLMNTPKFAGGLSL